MDDRVPACPTAVSIVVPRPSAETCSGISQRRPVVRLVPQGWVDGGDTIVMLGRITVGLDGRESSKSAAQVWSSRTARSRFESFQDTLATARVLVAVGSLNAGQRAVSVLSSGPIWFLTGRTRAPGPRRETEKPGGPRVPYARWGHLEGQTPVGPVEPNVSPRGGSSGEELEPAAARPNVSTGGRYVSRRSSRHRATLRPPDRAKVLSRRRPRRRDRSRVASAVPNVLHRPEFDPHFEVVQDSAAPVGRGQKGNQGAHEDRQSTQDALNHSSGTAGARLLPSRLAAGSWRRVVHRWSQAGDGVPRIGQRVFEADGLLHQSMVTAELSAAAGAIVDRLRSRRGVHGRRTSRARKGRAREEPQH